MFIHRASIMAVLAVALSAPRPAAGAESPGDAESADATAISLGEEGLRHFQAGRWHEALELFRKADAAVHAPTLVLYMAHCHARLGDASTAYRLYRAVTRERLAADAPHQFRTAQIVAGQQMRSIEPRLVPVEIIVSGAPEDQVRVLVDGKEVPASEIGDLALTPGAHVIEASVRGRAPVRRPLTTAPRMAARVELAFDPEPPTPPTPAPPAPAPDPVHPAAPPPQPRPADLFAPASVTLGVAGAALLVGTITGAVSLHQADEVKSRCLPGGHCPASDQDRAASAGRLADTSTAMFVVGALAAAGGVTLAVLHARGQARIGVDAHLGGATLRGSF